MPASPSAATPSTSPRARTPALPGHDADCRHAARRAGHDASAAARRQRCASGADCCCSILTILAEDLRRYWRLPRPRIAVCGLNPHAGEGGHLGDEEQRVIGPAIAQARAAGLEVEGPLPADTLFVPRQLERYDAVLAMYHDQGLPVLKHAGFGQAVNVTLGLPIVRTSVDHGTALDLAGTGRADAGSLLAAIELAAAMAGRRRP